MITKRPAAARGQANLGWLKTSYSFSFADYFDPAHMGYRSLRVLNDDVIAPGTGFGTHGHRDMEIVTYILSGALRHEDSQGNGAVLRAGDVQYMSAGRGILHSEFNASEEEPVHLFQLWILPSEQGLEPAYEDRSFSLEERTDALQLIVSRDGRDGSLRMNQAADIFATRLTTGVVLEHELLPGRGAWIQLASGSLELNGVQLGPGDGAAVEDEPLLTLRALDAPELLLIELD